MVENVLAALKPRRAASDHHALVETGARFWDWSGGQVHVDVVGNEEVEAAVAVIIDEGAACVPARAFARHAGLLADIGKGSIPVVVIEDILAVVGDEEIVPAIVVVVADANPLSPAGVGEPSFCGHVGESAITIVPEQMRRGFATGGKALESP